jgi:hypothetical protein
VAGNTAHLVTLDESDQQYLAALYQSEWQPVMDMMQQIG